MQASELASARQESTTSLKINWLELGIPLELAGFTRTLEEPL